MMKPTSRLHVRRAIRLASRRALSSALLTVLFALAQPASAMAQAFAAKTDYGTGFVPRSVTTGDFNGDGKRDLAVPNGGGNTVSVRLGTGTGSFAAKVDYVTGTQPFSVTTGDFNRDGKLDLAVTNLSSHTVSVLLGNGNGTFAAKVDYGTGTSPASVTTADFNGDGKLDLAVANHGSHTVSVLLGNGTGTFAANVDYGTGFNPEHMATGDFNGDGKLDLAVANGSSHTVSVLGGNGDGTFAVKVDYGTGTNPASVTTADFNGDGTLDLAVGNFGSATVSVLLGNGTGTFAAKVDYGTGVNPRDVTSGDFNGDGKRDLAVANYGSATVSVLLGTGTGTFLPKVDYGTGANPHSVTTGDFNGDGKLDLAVANVSSDTVSVLLNTMPATPVTFAAKVDYGTGANPHTLTTGDVNGDGKLDVAVTNSGNDTVSVLLGAGAGAFAAKVDYGTGSLPFSVTMGDFNGDGKLDLAVANNSSATVSVLLGTGTGTFAAKVDYGTGSGPRSVTTGDFNGDGKLDLAVANQVSATVSVLLGTGTGTFAANVDYGTGSIPHTVTTGDANADGTLDLAVANYGSDTVSVLLGTGTGTFSARVDYDTGSLPFSVTMGDFNGDGKLDLAVANNSSATVSVLLGTGTGTFAGKVDYGTGNSPRSLTKGDFNRDGKLDLAVVNQVSDTVSVLLGTGTGTFAAKVDYGTGSTPFSVTTGDVNGDGKLDLAVANFNSNTVSVLLANSLPSIDSIAANPSVFYPADRRMVAGALTVVATDDSGLPPTCLITGITFNTPQRGAGPDHAITGPFTFNARAERPTQTASRKYTITVTCTDGQAASSLGTVDVTVGLPPGRSFSALGGPDVLLVPACDTCAWTAASRTSWITITSGPTGVGGGRITYTVSANTSASSRTGTIIVDGQAVIITQAGVGSLPIGLPTGAPFGSVDTPVNGASGVTGSLAVTGWALDDTEVTRVRIYRAPVAGEVGVGANFSSHAAPAASQIFLGDAVLVPGARPDIATAYKTAPFANRAGWGYLLLTNLLPNRGNGAFTLSVYADDREGQTTLLGTRTFVGANANATRPFGAIDTPAQGETISGTAYVNFGWALTPLPKSIAADGSRIQVYIDGALVGPVSYGHYRADIASLFPGLANSVGPIGYRVIDTTKYANGLHTISWAVADSAGVSEGIGSRYFRIQNGASTIGAVGEGLGIGDRGLVIGDQGSAFAKATADKSGAALPSSFFVGSGFSGNVTAEASLDGHLRLKPDTTRQVRGRRGYDDTAAFESLARGDDGAFLVRTDALDRIELDLGGSTRTTVDGRPDFARRASSGERTTPSSALPIGATLDAERGLFVWQPGPGVLGEHDLVFHVADQRLVVRITIVPQ